MAKKTKKEIKAVVLEPVEKKKDGHCYTCGGKGEEGGCSECGIKK